MGALISEEGKKVSAAEHCNKMLLGMWLRSDAQQHFLSHLSNCQKNISHTHSLSILLTIMKEKLIYRQLQGIF